MKGKGWHLEPLRHSLARKGIKTGRKGYVSNPRKINITDVKTVTTTKYVNNEGFEFTHDPIKETLTLVETKNGYEARYLVQDNSPTNPDEWEDDNLFLVNYHRDFWVEKKDLVTKEDMQRLYQGHKIKQQKDYWVFPVDTYSHGIATLQLLGGFKGKLPQGHERFDVSSNGAIFIKKSEASSKKKAEKIAKSRLELWNQYSTGEVYGTVIDTYNKDKKLINNDVVWGNYGYEQSLKELLLI
jgi:hypothetical protein